MKAHPEAVILEYSLWRDCWHTLIRSSAHQGIQRSVFDLMESERLANGDLSHLIISYLAEQCQEWPLEEGDD